MLANLRENVSRLLANKKFLIIIIIASLFMALALYIYIYYISPKLDPSFVPNREFVKAKDEEVKHADIYLFYTDWCPHSKKSKPIYDAVKEQYEGKPINGIIVNFHTVNGEKDEDNMNEFEKKYKAKVDGYPTIFLVKGTQIIEYDAKVTAETLSEFLHTTL